MKKNLGYKKNYFKKIDYLLNTIQKFLFKKIPLIHNSYLSRKKLIRFSLKNNFLKIDDQYEFTNYNFIKSNKSHEKRQKIFEKIKSNDKFEIIVLDLISKLLPTLFLEGFKNNIENLTKNKIFKDKTKFIMTGNSYWGNMMFQVCAAELSLVKVPIYIVQHGGLFDILKYLPERNFVFDIADKFLTIGNKKLFEKKYRKKIVHQGYPKKNFQIKKIKNKNIILSINTRPIHEHRFSSQMAGSQFEEYLENIYMFLKDLDKKIRDKIIIKHPGSYNNADSLYYEKLKKSFPEIKVTKDENIFELLSDCRLHIGTVVSTVEFESLMMGVPTLIINFDKYQNFTSNGKKFLEKLRKLDIYFNGLPKSLSKKNLLLKKIRSNKFKNSNRSIKTLKKSFNKEFKFLDFN